MSYQAVERHGGDKFTLLNGISLLKVSILCDSNVIPYDILEKGRLQRQ